MSEKPVGPITVQWAFIVGVDGLGRVHLFDHEFVSEVRAKRIATLDDIYSAASQVANTSGVHGFYEPADTEYTLAFLVFQMPEGYIAASPNIFEDFIVLSGPGHAQVKGACSVIQMQITAQRTADLVAPMAVQATLSVLSQMPAKIDPDAANKTPGGLIRA